LPATIAIVDRQHDRHQFGDGVGEVRVGDLAHATR